MDLVHLHLLHICAGTRLTHPTSAPGLGSPLPHLHRDWAHPCHICAGVPAQMWQAWACMLRWGASLAVGAVVVEVVDAFEQCTEPPVTTAVQSWSATHSRRLGSEGSRATRGPCAGLQDVVLLVVNWCAGLHHGTLACNSGAYASSVPSSLSTSSMPTSHSYIVSPASRPVCLFQTTEK